MKIFSLIFFGFFCVLAIAKPPPNIMKNSEELATVQAALDICFMSSEYKSFKTNKALDFHGISSSIDRVLEKYEKKYDNSGMLYMAFKVSAVKYSDDKDFRAKLYQIYGKSCSEKMLQDAVEKIKEVDARSY